MAQTPIKFEGLPDDVHRCTSYRDGDEIVWKCPICEGYERRLNYKSGEMTVRKGGSDAMHTGASDGTDDMSGLFGNANLFGS